MRSSEVRETNPPSAGRVRVRMTVAYDGAPFRGFARNAGVATVQQVLEDALSEVMRHPVGVACAGRTDAGVHARGQVVSFDADEQRLDVDRLADSVNSLVGPTVAGRDVRIVADDFDARLSCTGRRYRYRIDNRPVADPLTRTVAWHFRHPVDLDAMARATAGLIGLHDFTSFCRRNKSRPTEVFDRRVHEAIWSRVDGEVHLEIHANAFCHQMVRSIVGTMVEIGRGRRRVVDLARILEARDRAITPSPAPPHGLIFEEAIYP